MSCRALGRGVEDAFLHEVLQRCHSRGARRARGTYRPTAKNRQTAGFYPRHGFAEVARTDDEVAYGLELPGPSMGFHGRIERDD